VTSSLQMAANVLAGYGANDVVCDLTFLLTVERLTNA